VRATGTISASFFSPSTTSTLVETALAEPPQSALSGVARMLVHAGKLQAKTAEDLVRQAREKKISFVNAVIASGQVSSADLAHTLASALALPLLDLGAMDVQRMPQNVIDAKLAQQYQVATRQSSLRRRRRSDGPGSHRAHQVRHPAPAGMGDRRA
jgi:hypothetical protein